MLKVVAIAAVGENGVIGKGSELPWNIPEDMKFFMDSTRGHIVLMGRKTFDALGKPLPKRENAVITRDESWKQSDVQVFHRLEKAIEYYQKNFSDSEKIIFVIGGAEIYKLSIPLLNEIWLTEIDATFDGDVFFPFYQNGKLDLKEFAFTKSEPQMDSDSPYQYRFNQYSRKT